MKQDKLLLPFSDIRASDLPLVGGKGANLGEMFHVELPVPPGFCVTTTVFDRFMADKDHVEEVFKLLDTINKNELESVRIIGNKVRQLLNDIPFPEEIKIELSKMLQEIGEDRAFAVRSSATAEDLPEASFAGQQDTYLNIIGIEALSDAIRRCWISLFTDRAILYRQRNNFSHREVKLSVVVQSMVNSEKSGIMFTVDPLTGHRHTLAIDASYGLGEALVSGMVSPDEFKIDKRSGQIIGRKIGEKKLAIYTSQDGGTITIDTTDEQRRVSSLSDLQINSLAELGQKIEKYYNSPQDIEWAIEQDKIYLLQTRPITSLYPIDGLIASNGSFRVYLSMGNQQSMTSAMTPLGMSTLKVLLPIGHSNSKFNSTLVFSSGNRLFANITPILRNRIFGKRVKQGLGEMDFLAPQAIEHVSNRPEFKQTKPAKVSFKNFRYLMKVVRRIMKAIFFQNNNGFVKYTNQLIDDYIITQHERIHSVLPGKEQIEILIDILNSSFNYLMHWIPQAGAGIGSIKILEHKAKRWLSAEEIDVLTLGIEGNVVQDMNFAIGDLADTVRGNKEITQAFETIDGDGMRWIKNIKQKYPNDPFIKSWNQFIDMYGSRGPAEIEFSNKRWFEDPLPILKVIAQYLSREEGRHRIIFEEMKMERERVMMILFDRVSKGIFGWFRYRFYRRMYNNMTTIGGMREHHKFFVIKLLGEVKKGILKNAQLLTNKGILNHPDDIFFLTWEELNIIWNNNSIPWKQLILDRREEMKRNEGYSINGLIITSDGEVPYIEYVIDDAPEDSLLGNPVSSGVVEGKVHVITNPVQESLVPGEILVAKFTDPGWTPLFINAKALVLEVGGALTHGAVVAREYGIPAVVGVKNATIELVTGQTIRVDGNRGIVEKIN